MVDVDADCTWHLERAEREEAFGAVLTTEIRPRTRSNVAQARSPSQLASQSPTMRRGSGRKCWRVSGEGVEKRHGHRAADDAARRGHVPPDFHQLRTRLAALTLETRPGASKKARHPPPPSR